MKIIKRYRNRRLYDMQASRTITQSELADMIKEGERVRVVESSTGDDITLSVLGRVLLAESSSWRNIRESRELLREIIYSGGDRSMSLLRNTVLASVGAIQVTKAKAEKIIDDLIKKGELNRSDRKKAVMELLEKAEKSTADFRGKVLREAEKTQKSVSKLAKELNWARQGDLKKLEAKVDKLARVVKELKAKVEAGE